jgi:hypothetical protein
VFRLGLSYPTGRVPRMSTRDRRTRGAAAVLAARLTEAALAGGRPGDVDACARHIAGEGDLHAGVAAADALSRALELVWQRGWMPSDVHAVTSRRLDPVAAGLVVDVIAAEATRYAESALHERWNAQLRALGAVVWWDPSRPHLGQWAQRSALSLTDAVAGAIGVIGLLLGLPQLPHVVPAPGSAAHAARGRDGVDARVLARVRALLAKAESTSFPDEAEALSAKAQELMARYAFEQAVVDAVAEAPQEAAARRVWLDAPYVGPKAQLIDAVAAANRCRTVFYAGLGFVALVGHETDLEIVELLSTSLQVQATRALLAEGKGARTRTRSFRHSFLIAYAHRIRERLDSASATADAVSRDTRLVPVLAARERAVEEKFTAMFPTIRTRTASVSNADGWGAGLAAADRADLDLSRVHLPAGAGTSR